MNKQQKFCQEVEKLRRMEPVAPKIDRAKLQKLFRESAERAAFNKTPSAEQKKQLNYCYGL